MVRITDFFKNLEQKRQEKQKLRKHLRSFHKRVEELDAAMERLISDHMVVKSIEEYYSYINNYIDCRDANEYCKNYIKLKVRKSYSRHDGERLR